MRISCAYAGGSAPGAQCVQSGGDDRRRRRTYPWTIKALFLRSPQDASEAADCFSGNCQLRRGCGCCPLLEGIAFPLVPSPVSVLTFLVEHQS